MVLGSYQQFSFGLFYVQGLTTTLIIVSLFFVSFAESTI